MKELGEKVENQDLIEALRTIEAYNKVVNMHDALANERAKRLAEEEEEDNAEKSKITANASR